MAHWIRTLVAGVVLVCLAAGATPALAAPYAAIVVDMRDGKVLHSRSADRRQHPASLTKMMTLYLTFEAVKNGQVSLDTKTRISRKASRMTGSRLRLKSGERVTIRDLIRATAIKSANDAAMALAEAIGGSEKAFAQMMTAKARELGMNSTTYKNPHGLTRSGHLTTARDQSVLARRLYYDFPEYYNIFSRRSDRAAGRRIYTTNRLLGTYKGMEGMKTGYTRAAGYNLVGIAARGQERIIAIVMGGRSSRTRNAKVAELLNLGFKRAPTRVATIRPGTRSVVVAASPVPQPKPGTPATGFQALTAALSSPAAAATLPTATAASRYAPSDTVRPVPRQRKGQQAAIAAASPAAHEKLGIPMPPAKPQWSVDLGRFTDEAGAVARLAGVAQKRGVDLDGARSTIIPKTQRGRTVYQVTFTGFTRKEATAVCASVGKLCSPIPPGEGG
ncbi:D-alanyl-D-alanine carboxypeptidase [Rhodobacteraceae bacterium NNCM2]|nr:D-alanyl-D-alanine carboxypeptidase [Coraliihabitans acroporae]